MNPRSSSVGRGPKREPRLRERFREETRLAILAAAERALIEDGLHGARMEAIAKLAGVAVGTVYNYFSDREKLVSALLDVRRRELLDRLDSVLGPSDDADFRSRLESYIGAMFDHFESHRELFRLLIQEEIGYAQKPGTKSTMMRELMTRAERLTGQGVAEGVLGLAGSERYGAILMGLIRGVLIHRVSSADSGSLQDAVALTVQFFLRGGAPSP